MTAVAYTVQPSFALGQRLLGARQSGELEAGAISLYHVHEPALLGCSFPLPPTRCKLWLVLLTVLPALTHPAPSLLPPSALVAAGELGENTIPWDLQGNLEPCTFRGSEMPPSCVETSQLQS